MKRGIFILLMAITFVACKSDKKNENSIADDSTSEPVEAKTETETETEKFEKSLLDYREISENYANDLPVQGFGMQKFNDSIFAFVFKLGSGVPGDVVEKYSIGIKGYHNKSDEPYTISASPEITNIGDENFLVIRRKIENIKYFDSIYTHTYTRDNWKASGRIKSFMLKDILFE